MTAGVYSTRLIRLVRTSEREPLYGQKEERFAASNLELWGSVEDLSGSERIRYGYLQSAVDCNIRIRNQPTLDPKDRLLDKATQEVYVIDGIHRGTNELILGCVRLVEPTNITYSQSGSGGGTASGSSVRSLGYAITGGAISGSSSGVRGVYSVTSSGGSSAGTSGGVVARYSVTTSGGSSAGGTSG